MNRVVFRQIPPLACDFSGASSVLFGLPGLHLYYCPASCTQPIAECDEIRDLQDSLVYYSVFGEVAAVMGSDAEFLIEAKLLADRNEDVEFITIVSTPVPAIVGSDLSYLATQLSEYTKKPVLVIGTTGFESYYSGVQQTLQELGKTFLKKRSLNQRQINLIGYTPLSLGYEKNLSEFVDNLEESGIKLRGLPQHTRNLEEFTELSEGALNIVLTHEGVALAQLMEKEFNIPYLLGLPIGISGERALFEKIEQVTEIQLPHVSFRDHKCLDIADKKVVVIGEPLWAACLVEVLKKDFGIHDTLPLSVLTRERKLKKSYREAKLQGVEYILSEEELQKRIMNFKPAVVFGDPLYERVLDLNNETLYVSVPHIGLSGLLFKEMTTQLMGYSGHEWLREKLKNKSGRD